MRAILFAGTILAAASQAAEAGPWARGKGRSFVSLSYELTVDRTDPLLTPNNEILLYGEHGLSPSLTFVLDGTADLTDNDRTLIAALNWSLARPDATHQVALLAGIGRRDDATGSFTFPVIGASWGRGFDTRWGGGWTMAEAQYRAAPGAQALAKLDLTLGIRPADRAFVYGQLQFARPGDGDPTARLTATMVYEVTEVVRAELGLLYGVTNDDTMGLRSGVWLEF